MSRVRPTDPAWPSEEEWSTFGRSVSGRLIKVESPLVACRDNASDCATVLKDLQNPYYLRDEVGLTQSLGWVDAWTSQPSVYAIAAETADDIIAAVNFARERNLRVVVKGGGHSYHGTSCAPDSLLIWTRRMNTVALHDAFVGAGCEGKVEPQSAVTVGAGAIWAEAYDAVATNGGRYVQGGGCLTVGVAGLVQSGGFGSFSKRYGTAAASLLEAEIVTADGVARIANACMNPDLFWAVKGGGGGSLGVVTRLTLKTHDLPEFFGATFLAIKANTDTTFRELIDKIIEFYRDTLFNPNWGEQIAFRRDRVLEVSMVFQGLTQQQAEATWQPFLDFVKASPENFSFTQEPAFLSVPAQQFWNPAVLRQVPGVVLFDDRPGAPEGNVFWASNLEEAGQVHHAYQSAWLPASLLEDDAQQSLVGALFAAAQHWRVSLHLNKALAGAPREVIEAARDTAMNPAAVDAFALLISASEGPPAYPGIPGHEPDVDAARMEAKAIDSAMNELRKLVPSAGSYISESDFFEKAWQQSYWGPNYARLLKVKEAYDPDGLFFVHHGVGSERWSADGFTRLS
jgi:FAD/FMN-containing dehydrogenase